MPLICPLAYLPTVPLSRLSFHPAFICTTPGTTYACTGGATDTLNGACSAIACAAGYSGTLSTPVCSVQGGTWTFAGTCVGELLARGRKEKMPMSGVFVKVSTPQKFGTCKCVCLLYCLCSPTRVRLPPPQRPALPLLDTAAPVVLP